MLDYPLIGHISLIQPTIVLEHRKKPVKNYFQDINMTANNGLFLVRNLCYFMGRSELHRTPQITTDTTDHTDPNHRSHRSLGNGTDPSKFIKYGSKSIKYGPGLPENHSDVPLASLGTCFKRGI